MDDRTKEDIVFEYVKPRLPVRKRFVREPLDGCVVILEEGDS